MAQIRFDKLIADSLGITRSEARTKIKKGRCSVDGIIIKDPSAKVDSEKQIVADGENASYKEFIYIMMNKPQGVISATDDRSQKTVLDLLPPNFSRYKLFPAGRLDIDTEGFLLITNDGQAAHNLLSPAKKVAKEYYARLALPLSDEDASLIEKGVDIGGYVTKPCHIEKITEKECRIEIVEGKFHQVKRMFEAVDNKVIYLKRESFASLQLDPLLSPGEYRFLTNDEENVILSFT
jgi:16S rRNA pseudouridine516 synthase